MMRIFSGAALGVMMTSGVLAQTLLQDGVVVLGVTEWEQSGSQKKDIAEFGLRIDGKTYPYEKMACGNILYHDGKNLDFIRDDFRDIKRLQGLFNLLGVESRAGEADLPALQKSIDHASAEAKVQCELHIS